MAAPRCPYCGKRMQQATISGVACWQCPKCLYTVPNPDAVPVQPEEPAAPEEEPSRAPIGA